MIQTERLVLREWRDSDRVPFARINADPRVAEFLGGVLTRAESDALVDRAVAHFAAHGFGLFVAEYVGDCIGFIGMTVPSFEAHFTPCVEIGWRLAPEHWGRGLATEGARALVGYAFETVGLNELVSFTVPANVASRRVMEKLGMTRDAADDFDHPRFPEGHPLRRHVLYRLWRG